MLCFVRPKEVHLNVLPVIGMGRSDMMAELQSVMADYRKEDHQEMMDEKNDLNLDRTSLLSFSNIAFNPDLSLAVKTIDVATEDSDEEPSGQPMTVLKRRKICG